MARKQEPAKSLSSVRSEYDRALENYLTAANMLATAVSTVLSLDSRAEEIGQTPIPEALREALQSNLEAFELAR